VLLDGALATGYRNTPGEGAVADGWGSVAQPHVPATAIADLVRAMPALPDADIAALGRIEQSKAASFRCQAAILRIAIQATARCRTNGRG
jgi:hypothetical protein